MDTSISRSTNTALKPSVPSSTFSSSEKQTQVIQFVTTLLVRNPLSKYFPICCTHASVDLDAEGVQFSEATAVNHVWVGLLCFPVATIVEADNNFATALEASEECFTDLLVRTEEMDTTPL